MGAAADGESAGRGRSTPDMKHEHTPRTKATSERFLHNPGALSRSEEWEKSHVKAAGRASTRRISSNSCLKRTELPAQTLGVTSGPRRDEKNTSTFINVQLISIWLSREEPAALPAHESKPQSVRPLKGRSGGTQTCPGPQASILVRQKRGRN